MGNKHSAKTVMIMAGGTGGHIFPALAAADCLHEKGLCVNWLGAKGAIEADIVGKTDIPIDFISVSGLRGKGFVRLLTAPFKLINAVWQSIGILRKVKPACVLGMGGFASGPGGIAAWILRIPLVIHEQNAIMGVTNKILSRFAKKVLLTYPQAFNGKKSLHTGNPIRQAIDNESVVSGEVEKVKNIVKEFSLQRPFRVLILGGSQGALSINRLIPKVFKVLNEKGPIELWHQTGKRHLESTLQFYGNEIENVKVDAFIDDMAAAYRWADLVVCRAGATTLAEITVAAVVSILIPFPYAVDDHQRENARYLEEGGAAICITEKELNEQVLTKTIIDLQSNAEKRQAMSLASRKLAKPDAAECVAKQCIEICYG